jgi:hypothetical protein
LWPNAWKAAVADQRGWLAEPSVFLELGELSAKKILFFYKARRKRKHIQDVVVYG